MTGIELIAKERQEQIEKHGYTLEHDAEVNYDGQLIDAGMSIVFPTPEPPRGWNRDIWNKMRSKSLRERLILAATFFAAEIDRLQSS